MKATVPTITETPEAFIIRIPKAWARTSRHRLLTETDVLRIVSQGKREFREGKTEEFATFLSRRYPAHATTFERSR